MSEPLGELFDPSQELLVYDRLRPHWGQAGAIVFVTFRMHDSIPKEVVLRWEREKKDWLIRNGINDNRHWSTVVSEIELVLQRKFKKQFNRCRESFLDTCHGSCVLRNPSLANIVADSLMYFDGVRYRMGDFVVMPNHVHLLAAFPSASKMKEQFDSWLHYTAFRINKAIGKKGHFWQQEPFDHLVRSIDQYDYLRKYILENPVKANLQQGEFVYRRYEDSR